MTLVAILFGTLDLMLLVTLTVKFLQCSSYSSSVLYHVVIHHSLEIHLGYMQLEQEAANEFNHQFTPHRCYTRASGK